MSECFSIESRSVAETEALGERLARALDPPALRVAMVERHLRFFRELPT